MDFSNFQIIPKMYRGANGKKICISIDNELYMLKFPPLPQRKDSGLKYSNSCFSEHIACSIFNTLEIPAQKTELGTFTIDGKTKIVVACKDFEVNNYVFQDFGSLKNSVLTSTESGYGTELDDVLYSINSQQLLDPEIVKKRFWEMFIVDSYIGNFDRHNGNWGFLTDLNTLNTKLAPVFDCGSSLFPLASDEKMKTFLQNKKDIEYRTFAIPRSALKINDIKINPYEFLQKTDDQNCIDALKKITPKILEQKKNIQKIIESTPYISDIHKTFLQTVLASREKHILLEAYSLHKTPTLQIRQQLGKGLER